MIAQQELVAIPSSVVLGLLCEIRRSEADERNSRTWFVDCNAAELHLPTVVHREFETNGRREKRRQFHWDIHTRAGAK